MLCLIRLVRYWSCIILATSNFISGHVATWDSVHWWWLYRVVNLESKHNTITRYPTLSHYPDTEVTSPCPILLMLRARLGSNKYQFDVIGLTWPGTKLLISHTRCPHSTDWATMLGILDVHKGGPQSNRQPHQHYTYQTCQIWHCILLVVRTCIFMFSNKYLMATVPDLMSLRPLLGISTRTDGPTCYSSTSRMAG